MICAETAGFLFHHDCGREADAHCSVCGKAVCALHTRTAQGSLFCITCLKKFMLDRPQLAGEPSQPQPAAAQARPYASSPWYTYDDPYWYTRTHYPSYHEHDFAAEDRKAFEAAAPPASGAEEAFETDREAS